MADTGGLHFIVNELPKRTRRIHHKTKTGCHTCKVRRKKCGEEKPFCARCTSTGRKCDGYEKLEEKTDTAQPLVRLSPASPSKAKGWALQLCEPPDLGLFQTDQDYYCFDFFRRRTGPEVAAYFDSSIWLSFMLRACSFYPTVLQAAAAVGAVHRRFELGISPEAFRFCGIALNQHRKALRCLDQDLLNGNPFSAEINMLVSMLLAVFEIFQGNIESAIAHYKSGFSRLLRRDMKVIHSESQRRFANVDYKTLHNLTDRLEQRAPQLFGSPTVILSDLSVDAQLAPVPLVFVSLEQARDVIITEGHYIWHAWRQLELGNLKGFSTQHLHVSRLLEWSRAYAEYHKSIPGLGHTSRRPHLLKAYREALYFILLTQLAFHEPDGQAIVPLCFLPDQCDRHTICRTYAQRKSALNTHFARMMTVAESLFEDDSNFAYYQHSISLDSGIGPSLNLNAVDCMSTKVRYQATSILPEGDLRNKVSNLLGVYNIAEKLGSLEEHAVLATVVIPKVANPKWVDVACFLEEKKMLLRHCSQDEFGGLIWTQEWITY